MQAQNTQTQPRYYDISPELTEQLAVWPGDTPALRILGGDASPVRAILLPQNGGLL